MQATETLRGERVSLRPLRPEDVVLETRWSTDPEVVHWLHRSEDGPEYRTRTAIEQKIRSVLADPAEVRFIIETDEGVPIGDVGLLGIHPHGRAELSIRLGEKAYWSRGYGTDAIRTLLGLAFGALGLRRVTLIADADNARGIRCYEKCGFRHEGVLRGHRLRYAKPLDMVAMAVSREEFQTRAGDARSA
jgi:RimJ/RimL family protein N-acetyltransferase